jgi:F-type H+-transporting ATPase subunit delta
MKISPQQYAVTLYESLDGKSASEQKAVLAGFVASVQHHGDAKKWPEIIGRFSDLWNKEHGLLEAELISARHLGEGAKELITDYLKERTGAKKIDVKETSDPGLIGGFILKYGSRILDGSLKNALGSLRDKISN